MVSNSELPNRSDRNAYAIANTMRRLADHVIELFQSEQFLNLGIQRGWKLRSLYLWEEDHTTQQQPPQTQSDSVGDQVVFIVLSVTGSFSIHFDPTGIGLIPYNIFVCEEGVGYAVGQKARWEYHLITVMHANSCRYVLRVGASA